MFNSVTIEETRKLKLFICEEYQSVAEETMKILDEGFEDSMTIIALPPSKYRITLRTSNLIERENLEIQRCKKMIRVFLITDSVIRLIGAILHDDHNDWQAGQHFSEMTEYYEKNKYHLAKAA